MKPPAAAGAYCCAFSEYSTLVKFAPAVAAAGVEQRTAAAQEKGLELGYEDAREIVYGMPYGEWKSKYQKEASAGQLDKFKDSQ